jgi:hypothetical protein
LRFETNPKQIVLKTLSQKKKKSHKRTGGVAQGVGPDFKPQYCKNKKKNKWAVVFRLHQQILDLETFFFFFFFFSAGAVT